VSARVVLKPSTSLAVEWFKPCICGNQDHSRVKYSFSYTRVIILVTTLRTTSGHGPKPCIDLDFTHAIKMSGTTRKITRVCAVVTRRYCIWSGWTVYAPGPIVLLQIMLIPISSIAFVYAFTGRDSHTVREHLQTDFGTLTVIVMLSSDFPPSFLLSGNYTIKVTY